MLTHGSLSEAVARKWADPEAFDDERLRAILTGGRGGAYYAPAGELLSRWVADVATPYVPAAEQTSSFQRLEVTLDLLGVHEDSRTDLYTHGPSFGTYANRNYSTALEQQLQEELEAQGVQRPPVAQGLFEGNLARADQALESLISQSATVRQQRH